MTPLLAAGWIVGVLAIVFIVVCILMILVILIQKPRGGGLSGAFGGAGGSAQSVFGSKTGDVATWFTVAMFVAFILLAMGMQWTITPATVPTAPTVTPPTPASPTTTPGQTDTADTDVSLLPPTDPDDLSDYQTDASPSKEPLEDAIKREPDEQAFPPSDEAPAEDDPAAR